jgi:hypothetical protein
MVQQEIVERIIDLSAKALSEEDRGKFTDCLKERAALMAHLTGDGLEGGEGALKAWLEIERKISTRLEKERLNVLREIETLAAKKRAMHRYSPRRPFPPMPVFFDEAG